MTTKSPRSLLYLVRVPLDGWGGFAFRLNVGVRYYVKPDLVCSMIFYN